MAAQPATIQDYVDYLTTGFWADANQAPPTYASGEITVDLTGLTDGLRDMTRLALRSWESVANLHFHEVAEGAQIVFDDTWGGTGQGWDYENGVRTNVHVNFVESLLNGTGGTSIGGTPFKTFLHEIGHALGLGHGGDYDGRANFETDALFQNDSMQLSLMSYFSTWDNPYLKPTTSYAMPFTPMMADILAVQQLFGAPEGGITAGDTIWGRGSNLGPQFAPRFEGAYGGLAGYSMTIYDENGTDLIDFSNDRFGQRIDLTPGSFSDVYQQKGNLAIMPGTLVENVRAGLASDSVTGNEAANHFLLSSGDDRAWGGAGHDRLEGESGNDRLWGGAGNDVLSGSTGRDTLRGEDGRDTLDGGKSNDILKGGAGNDTLSGGAGQDRLVFDGGRDLVLAFEHGRDTLVLDDALWGGRDLTRAEVLAKFGHDRGDALLLDFGDGDRIRIEGLGSLDLLREDVVVI